MKTLFATVIVTLVTAASLFGAQPPLLPVDSSKTPKGLSGSDWSGIRGVYEKNRHAIVANPDGSYQARNPGQAWLTKFDGRGFTVTPDTGGWTWGLEMEGYGKVTEVRKDDGRVSYIREDGLTEWFVNDARGLEQGWTLTKRPETAGTMGPVRLGLAVRGGLRPQIAAEGASVAFLVESGQAALIYGGLKAWDADRKNVQVRFVEGGIEGKELDVEVNDANAKYPITVDPLAQQAYLKASNTGADDQFGISVAISGDTVVVGALGEASSSTGVNGNQADNSAPNSGAAYVFVRNGENWNQQAYLKASNTGVSDQFGFAVSVSGDIVVVGARGEDSIAAGVNGNEASDSGFDSGAAYVFVRSGTSWSQQAYLKASRYRSQIYFGSSVSVSGNILVVGAFGEASNATGINGNQADGSAGNSGAAYVFVRNGTTWSQEAYLKASNTGAGDGFGNSLALFGDTVVVGASGEASNATGVGGNQADNSADNSGAAYVFIRSGTTWSQQAYLKASNTGQGDEFGVSVGISWDLITVGAYNEDSSATGINGDQADNSAPNSGAAYVFVRNGSTWSQEAYLKASSTGAGDGFGISTAVSGSMVGIGAFLEDSSSTGTTGNQLDNSASSSGAAYVFIRSGTTWSQQAYLKASNTGADDYFGRSIAVSGETVVVGTPYEDSSSTGVGGNQMNNSLSYAGAVYIFDETLYQLTTTAANGIITGGGSYPPGNTANLLVSPNPGYLFAGWTGDASGSANPLSVAMNSDKAITATFSPDTLDDDNDGLTNYQEIVVYGTNPALPDTDGDGVKDSKDALPLDPAETLDTDQDGTGDNADLDDDGDGLWDVDELTIHGTNSKRADSDGDGLSDPDELQIHLTNPNLADTDSDGLSDGAEFITHHTNPKIGDTDGDGFLDGYEVLTGKSPLNILDKPALVAEARTAIEFTFSSALGKTYRIEDSFDLAIWTTVESGISGNGTLIQRFYTTRNVPKRYFRVEEDAP